MLVAYFCFIFAFLLFCRNAGLGSLSWERYAIVLTMSIPTVAFCATALGALILCVMLCVMIDLIIELATPRKAMVIA